MRSATQSTDCAVGSGQWAEPPHPPWALHRRGVRRRLFLGSRQDPPPEGPPRINAQGGVGGSAHCVGQRSFRRPPGRSAERTGRRRRHPPGCWRTRPGPLGQSVILASGTSFTRLAGGSPRSDSSARLRSKSPGGWGGPSEFGHIPARAGVFWRTGHGSRRVRAPPGPRGEGRTGGRPDPQGCGCPHSDPRQGGRPNDPGRGLTWGSRGTPWHRRPWGGARDTQRGSGGAPRRLWITAGYASGCRTGGYPPDPPTHPPPPRLGGGSRGGPRDTGGPAGTAPRAHFFGYLITLPVGTKMGHFLGRNFGTKLPSGQKSVGFWGSGRGFGFLDNGAGSWILGSGAGH